MLLSSPLYSSLFAFRILEHKIISYRFWVLCIKDRAESAQEKGIQGCLKERNWKASFIFLVREGMDQEKRETKEPDCVEGEIKCYKILLWAICFHKMPHVTFHGIKRCSKHNYWFIWYYLTLMVCSILAPGDFKPLVIITYAPFQVASQFIFLFEGTLFLFCWDKIWLCSPD